MKWLRAVGLVLLLAACSSEPPRPAPSVALSPSMVVNALTPSVRAFSTTSYRFKMTANEGVYSGGIDPVGDKLDSVIAVSSQGLSLKIETIGTGGAYFTRISGSPLPGMDGSTWYQVDTSRVHNPGSLGISANHDPTGILALVAAIRTVSGSYTGTVDLSKVAHWGPVNPGRLGAVVPYSASTDSSGRLVSMKVDVPSDPVTAVYSDFGVAVPVVRPSSAEPMPDTLYGMLNL